VASNEEILNITLKITNQDAISNILGKNNNITITGNTDAALAKLNALEQKLKDIQKASNITITGSTPEVLQRNIQRQILRSSGYNQFPSGNNIQSASKDELAAATAFEQFKKVRASQLQDYVKQGQQLLKSQQVPQGTLNRQIQQLQQANNSQVRNYVNGIQRPITQNQNQALAGTLNRFLPPGGGSNGGGPGGVVTNLSLGAGLAGFTAAGLVAEKVFETLSGTLKNVADAGLVFQKSIVAIAGVLQETTNVPGTTAEQIATQTGNARQIQLAARSALLPLGIGGQAESSLVRSLISGSAQRGISLNANQTGILSGRLGAAITTLRPELLSNPNRLQRDIEDILAGSPRAKSTTLGVGLQGVAPGIFSARSGDELLKATANLDKLSEALLNSDQATVQVTRALGAFDNIQTQVGDTLLQSLQPGIKVFADALGDKSIIEGLQVFAKGFGEIGSVLLEVSGGVLAGTAEGFKTIYNIAAQIAGLKPLGSEESPGTKFGSANIRTQLQGILNPIGLTGENASSDKIIEKIPEFQIDQLSQAQRLLARNNTPEGRSLQEEQLPVINETINNALDKQFEDFKKGLDTGAFSGRRAANNEFLNNVSIQKIANLQDTLAIAQPGSPLETDTNRQITQVLQQEILARRDNLHATLEETAAKHQIRDAEDNLKFATSEVSRNLLTFTSNLQSAKDAASEFGDNLKAQVSGKENEILSQAQEVQKLGGVIPDNLSAIIGDPEALKSFQLKGASDKLNASLASVGLGGIGQQNNGTTNLFSQGSGGSFQDSLQSEGIKLINSVGEASDALDKVANPARNAAEALEQLSKIKDLLNPETATKNSQIIGPGGTLTNSPGGLASSTLLTGGVGTNFAPLVPGLKINGQGVEFPSGKNGPPGVSSGFESSYKLDKDGNPILDANGNPILNSSLNAGGLPISSLFPPGASPFSGIGSGLGNFNAGNAKGGLLSQVPGATPGFSIDDSNIDDLVTSTFGQVNNPFGNGKSLGSANNQLGAALALATSGAAGSNSTTGPSLANFNTTNNPNNIKLASDLFGSGLDNISASRVAGPAGSFNQQSDFNTNGQQSQGGSGGSETKDLVNAINNFLPGLTAALQSTLPAAFSQSLNNSFSN
jgi:hypothetical protein